ncbi:MAG TPA: pyridoxamine 5'-phosphate oxidase family protein [Ilumatobacteraceae bacterium]|nr:pyridoxamine 5'-phosphate oxidase family protein [Ilumatobacteraceae bacterium]
MSVRLTDDEVWSALEGAHTAVLTTLKRDGAPIALPVWFAVVERSVYISTPAQSKKLARVRRDPRASLLIESGERWVDLVAAHLSGYLEVVDDQTEIDAATQAIDRKYAAFRPAVAKLPAATRQHYAGRTMLRFVPHGKVLSWDNSKIRMEP